MIDPGTAAIAAAGINAGSSLVGGYLDRKAGELSSGEKWINAFPIQAAVRDAKAAGLHPLFALGAGGISPSPRYIEGQSNTGTHLANAGAAIAQGVTNYANVKSQKPLAQANLRVLNSQADRNEAETAAILSKTAFDKEAANVNQDGLLSTAPTSNVVPSHRTIRDIDGTLRQIPNTEAGFELPEAVGAWELFRGSNTYKWIKKTFGFSDKTIRQKYFPGYQTGGKF